MGYKKKYKFITKSGLHLFIIILLVLVSYVNMLDNEFIDVGLDDSQFPVLEPHLKDWSNIISFFKGQKTAEHGRLYEAYRPLAYTSHLITYKMWGLSPFGYHLNALIVYLIVIVLVYFVVKHITNSMIAFLTTLLFGVHAVHTEVVSYAFNGAFMGLSFLFLFLSFYLYIRSEVSKNKLLMYLGSLLFALLAFFTYEITIVLPLLIIFYDICFKKIKKYNLKSKIKQYLPYFLAVIFYFFMKFVVLGFGAKTQGGWPFYKKMLVMSYAFFRYIFYAILPINLGEVWFWKYVDASILNPKSFLPIIVFFVLVWLVFKFLRKQPVISFGIGWFIISLLPVSNIFPVGTVMAERYMYIALFGYCLLMGYLVYKFFSNKSKIIKYVAVIAYLFLVIFNTGATISRNNDWQDGITMWEKTIEQSPESSAARLSMGLTYLGFGEYDKGVIALKKSLQLELQDIGDLNSLDRVYSNLAYAYSLKGDYDLTIHYNKKAIEVNPNNYRYYNNIGWTYFNKGDYEEAEVNLKKSLEINPNFELAKNNLEYLYLVMNKT